MQVCIIGAGAIGGWIAARLGATGMDVTIVARGETMRCIASSGLKVDEAGKTISTTPRVIGDPAALGIQDVVLLAVKAPALPGLAPSLAPLLGPRTLVVPMLNGVPWWFTRNTLRSVDPDAGLSRMFPLSQVIGCVVHASCYRTAPNRIVVKHAERLILGEPDGRVSSRVTELCAMFAASGIACDPSDDIRRAIWYKLWGNATINPLSALTRSTADRLLTDPALRGLMTEAMDELARVGAAIGCPISQSAEDRMAVTARLGAFKSSMLQDVEAGRQIELEALLGAPLEIARGQGIATPQLDRLYAMTRLMAEELNLL